MGRAGRHLRFRYPLRQVQELPKITTPDRIVSIPVGRLLLRWSMGARPAQLQSQWVDPLSLISSLAEVQGLLPVTDSPPGKALESNLPVVLLDQSVKYDT